MPYEKNAKIRNMKYNDKKKLEKYAKKNMQIHKISADRSNPFLILITVLYKVLKYLSE